MTDRNEAAFEAAWPEIHKAGPRQGWRGIAWAAWNAAKGHDSSAALEPIEGDLLPPIGSKVQIHLNSLDAWVEHTVTGYYVWAALSHQIKPGERHANRVFVRVVDANGYPNARLLADVRTAP